MIRAEIWARNTNFTLMYDRPPRRVGKGRITVESAPVYRLAPRGAEHNARPTGGVILERKVATPARAALDVRLGLSRTFMSDARRS